MAEYYIFGPYHLDPEAGDLRRGDEKLEIRPKCFDLLLYLIDHRGKLIAKETLLAEVWEDVVVSESALTRTIAELREILQDSAEDPRFIETSQRRGYKFVAQVRKLEVGARRESSSLMLVHGDKEYHLQEGSQLIGRGRDVAILLYGSRISRHHARISVNGYIAVLEDLQSRNGTLVNGERVTAPVSLQLGDRIEIGGEILVLWSPTGSTSPAPTR